MMKQKLTAKELAADAEFGWLFRNTQGVYRAVERYGLTAVKPMGVLMFDRREVRAWVERSRCNATPREDVVLLKKGVLV